MQEVEEDEEIEETLVQELEDEPENSGKNNESQ